MLTPGFLQHNPGDFVAYQQINGYTADALKLKQKFHREARYFLRELAQALKLREGADCDIRQNAGGMAVSGEVTLHAERLYVQLYESACGSPGISALVRTCNGARTTAVGRGSSRCLCETREGRSSFLRCAGADGRE
jgi:hypothetical protein